MNLLILNKFRPIHIIAMILLCLWQLTVDTVFAGQTPKRVFVLNSFNRGYAWTDNMLKGIDDTFERSGIKVEQYVKFMDMKRIAPTPEYFSLLKETIQLGYKGVHFDAVLACDNDALEFMRKYRDVLFPGVPVVFSSINDFDEQMLDKRNDITGTSENTDYTGTIEVAIKLRPSTKNIIVVVDNTTTGKAHRSAVEKIQSNFPKNIIFTYLSLGDLSLDELMENLSKLQNDSIVLLLQHFVDKNRTTYTVQDSTPMITRNCSVQVFVLTDIRMGLGALGGLVVSGYHHGQASAQMVVDILKGRDVRLIPVLLDSPNQYMFDYGVMQRFKISEKALPKDSILINKPVSLLENYKKEIWLILILFSVLTAMLFYLLFEINRRRKIETGLRESNEKHRILFDGAGDAIYIHDADAQILSINQKACALLGYTHADLMSMTIDQVNTPKEAQYVKDRIVQLMVKGHLTFETMHQCKDGSSIPVEVSSQIIKWEGQTAIMSICRNITERKQAEAAMNEIAQRLKLATSSAGLGIWDWELTCNKMVWDDQMLELYGLTKEIFPGGIEAWQNGLHPEDRDKTIEECQAALRGEKEWDTDFRVLHPDGTTKYIKAKGMVIRDSAGTPVRMLGINFDITERKLAENKLAKAVEDALILKTAITQMPIGVALADQNLNLYFCNPAGLGLRGGETIDLVDIPKEAYQNWQVLKLDGQPYEIKDLPLIRTITEGKIIREDFIVRHADGSDHICDATAAPVFDRDHKLIGGLVIFPEITERKQIEDALRKSEERHRSILQTAMDGIWLTDFEGHIIEVNETYCQMSGYGMQELLSMNVRDIEDIESQEDTAAHIQKILNHGKDRFESRHRRKDGTVFDVEVSVQYRPEGRQFLAFIQDISEHKNAEKEKIKLESQLLQAQKMESIGRLAGGVAHDFNNMLTLILGYTQVSMDEIDPSEPLHHNLQEILCAAQRSADLTRQLLTFARKQIIEPKVINLNQAIKQMMAMLQRLIGENIDLIWKPAESLWPLKMDPSQIDQILANLCINAKDAITDVGKLTIETGMVSFDSAYCENHVGFVQGDFVLLSVSDDGCGMDKETLNNLFEPFFTTKEMGKGTGLGLATVYGIVKQNNGFIDVYSESGEGTSFKIYLPRHSATQEISKINLSEESVPGGNETILLVEDEPSILRLTQIMLERLGYSVIAAAFPRDAIRLAREHSGTINLLMTDVIMPEMNGQELAGQMAELYPDIKILFMSGYTADIIDQKGVLSESITFIQKPFSRSNLAAKVRRILNKADDENPH